MSGFSVTTDPSEPRNNDLLSFDPFDTVNPIKYLEYLIRGTGTLATSGIAIGAFVHSGVSPDSRPDIQIHTFPGLLTMDFDLAFRKAGNIADNAYENLFRGRKEE